MSKSIQLKDGQDDDLYPYGIVKGEILWTNPNPTSSFASQTITLSSDDYDMYEVYYKDSSTGAGVCSIKSIKGFGSLLTLGLYTDKVAHFLRGFNYVSDTQFNISDCFYFNKDTQSSDSKYIIPLYVVGYKSNLFK